MKKKKDIPKKIKKKMVAVLGTFYRDYNEHIGYTLFLRKDKEDGFALTPVRNDAVFYDADVKKGKGTPEEWCKIINEEYPNFPKLHPIYFTPKNKEKILKKQ